MRHDKSHDVIVLFLSSYDYLHDRTLLIDADFRQLTRGRQRGGLRKFKIKIKKKKSIPITQ